MSIEMTLLGQILNMSRDPEGDLNEFSNKVASSPRLATEIVRIANSALYGMEGRIHQLERALMVLGVRTVASIASSILVGDKVRDIEIGGVTGDQLWMHSLETGTCAQLMARCLSQPLESEAYLAGLLHDLGMLDLFSDHGTAYAELVELTLREPLELHELEQERFGETHASRLGGLLRAWDFPELLQVAVGAHHAPETAPESSRMLAALVKGAHCLITDPTDGWQDATHGPDDATFLADLGLLPEDVGDLRAELTERMKKISAVL
jgi:HD-like signal output (HDOD) protein